MGKRIKPGRIGVCLLGSHPAVLEQWHKILGGSEFRVEMRQLRSAEMMNPTRTQLPDAQVFVIDAEGPRAVTETLLAGLQTAHPGSRAIVVGGKLADAAAFGLLRQGARGLLTFKEAQRQLPRAVQSVVAGGYWVPRQVLSEFVNSILHAGGVRAAAISSARLSRREREVCDALLENLSNKEIGTRQNISERTVKFHVSNLLAKFGVQRRADLILLCYQGEKG